MLGTEADCVKGSAARAGAARPLNPPCTPSGRRRTTPRMDLATAEFVAVDVETNGRAGDDCEITEVGAVLVGGGELHDRYESLVRVERPLGRGIERFTGISAAMLADAPTPSSVLSELRSLIGERIIVAHSASFDRGVLAHAFERAGLA